MAYADGLPYDPSLDTVQMAFVTIGADPTSGDWHTGSWEAAQANNTYFAQVLVGPANSGVVLARGTYAVWVKITDNPEIPVAQVGTIQIF